MRMLKYCLVICAVVLAASQTTWAQKSESRFASLDGARVHYINYGKGDEALVLGQ